MTDRPTLLTGAGKAYMPPPSWRRVLLEYLNERAARYERTSDRLEVEFYLVALMGLFAELKVDDGPLHDLFEALLDREEGHVHPLFEPVEKGRGRKADKTHRRKVKAWAAATVELLRQQSDRHRGEKTKACRRVAQVLNKHGFPWWEKKVDQSAIITHQQVADLHKNCSKADPQSQRAKDYAFWLEANLTAADPRAALDRTVSAMMRRIRQLSA